jgi:hypothetical protein
MLISVARWLLCIVAIAAVLVEWVYGGDHPVVWLTLCGVAWALRFVGRDSKST